MESQLCRLGTSLPISGTQVSSKNKEGVNIPSYSHRRLHAQRIIFKVLSRQVGVFLEFMVCEVFFSRSIDFKEQNPKKFIQEIIHFFFKEQRAKEGDSG